MPSAHTEILLIELYNASVSTCSQKVRMALWEKDLPWQDRPVVFQKNDHLSDWYLAINPNGVVPALVHDGKTIIDSSVINEYLEDVFPDRPLRPRDPFELAHMRAWRQFIDEVPTVAIRYPSFNAAFVHIWADMSDEEHRKYVDRRPLRKHFYRRMGRDGFPKEDVDAALDMLRMTVTRMQSALEKTEWLANDKFTLADVASCRASYGWTISVFSLLGRSAEGRGLVRAYSKTPGVCEDLLRGLAQHSSKLLKN